MQYPTPIGKPQLPDILQFTYPRTLSTEGCKRSFKGNAAGNNVHESNLCTMNAKNVGACMGDSGGPLVDVTDPENKTLVGIVSWGIPVIA